MDKRDKLYLQRIRDAAEKTRRLTENVSFEDFEIDELLQGAVIDQFMIIGETASKMSDEFRDAHAEWPWSGMIALSNKAIPDYSLINQELVWENMQQKIPEIQKLIDELV